MNSKIQDVFSLLPTVPHFVRMFVAFAVYWPTRLVAKYFLDTNDELELEAFVFQPLNFVKVQPEQAESDENK